MTQEHPASPVYDRFAAWKAGLILYLTLVVLALAIPENLVAWVKDRPEGVQNWLLGYAEGLERISERVGADKPYKLARDYFLKVTGKDTE